MIGITIFIVFFWGFTSVLKYNASQKLDKEQYREIKKKASDREDMQLLLKITKMIFAISVVYLAIGILMTIPLVLFFLSQVGIWFLIIFSVATREKGEWLFKLMKVWIDLLEKYWKFTLTLKPIIFFFLDFVLLQETIKNFMTLKMIDSEK